ncbi:hypothetical protein KCU62_g406, partial [Aureobasidium sp. EXF-3399]
MLSASGSTPTRPSSCSARRWTSANRALGKDSRTISPGLEVASRASRIVVHQIFNDRLLGMRNVDDQVHSFDIAHPCEILYSCSCGAGDSRTMPNLNPEIELTRTPPSIFCSVPISRPVPGVVGNVRNQVQRQSPWVKSEQQSKTLSRAIMLEVAGTVQLEKEALHTISLLASADVLQASPPTLSIASAFDIAQCHFADIVQKTRIVSTQTVYPGKSWPASVQIILSRGRLSMSGGRRPESLL